MTNRFLLATAVALSLTITLAAQVQKKDVPGIRNYSRVDATVGCGGAVDPAAMAGLKKEGYVSVINLRLANEEGADVDAGRAAASCPAGSPCARNVRSRDEIRSPGIMIISRSTTCRSSRTLPGHAYC